MDMTNGTEANRQKGRSMSCTICGAPADNARNTCPICGYTQAPGAKSPWDRSVEAWAYEDLQQALEEGEALLAVTRGRIAGSWRRKLTLNPQTFLSPFVNVGLTADRLILQQIHQTTGRAASDKVTGFPLSSVVSLAVSDADPMEAGKSVRLNAVLSSGESFRLRASGRVAEGAKELFEVWQSVARGLYPSAAPAIACPHCSRELDRPHKFCPFCGKTLGETV
jgi:RNA polymerase subunit RPABC4/transcription elongation factor Spt4